MPAIPKAFCRYGRHSGLLIGNNRIYFLIKLREFNHKYLFLIKKGPNFAFKIHRSINKKDKKETNDMRKESENRKELSALDTSLFRINMPTGAPKPGVLLVAEPFLREEYFNHAVISLIEYARGRNSMGLVLNKPTGYTLGEAIEGIDTEIDIPIYCGGPVSCDRLFYIHSLGDELPGARRLSDDLYIGGDFESVKAYVNMGLPTDGLIRFFVGYSGWDSRQLEEEIENHVWAVVPQPANRDILHEDGDAFWYRTVRSMGEPYRHWLYHPLNPQLN